MTYDEIINFLSKKYKIAERDCERIVDSQFKVLQETIQKRELKVVNLIKLGKFSPLQRILNNREEYEKNTIEINKRREEEINSNNTDNRGTLEQAV